MSVAVDVSRPSDADAPRQFEPCIRPDGRREVTPILRPSFISIVGGARHAMTAWILHQVIYWNEKCDKFSLSIRYVARHLELSNSIVTRAKARLVELGFIEVDEASGIKGSDRWIADLEAVLEALEEHGYQNTIEGLAGRSGNPNDPPFGLPEQSDAHDRSGNRDKKEPNQKKDSKDSGTGRERGRDQARANQTQKLADKMANVWPEADEADADYVLTALYELGFPAELAMVYALERVEEMRHRSNPPVLKWAKRYMLNRDDMQRRGYKIRDGLALVGDSSTRPASDESSEKPPENPTESDSEKTADELDEGTNESPPTNIHSSAVQELADDLRKKDPQMTRREAEKKALHRMLEQ